MSKKLFLLCLFFFAALNLRAQTDTNVGALGVSGNATFCGPSPWVDIRCYGARPLVTFPYIPNLYFTASINSGSTTLTTSSAGQIQNGDYLAIAGAGSGNSVGTSAPSAPTVTPSIATGPMMSGLTAASAAGSTTYSYEIMWCDHQTMACTPPSAATTITNGQATLGSQTIALTSGTRAGNIVTVTTAASHVMPVGCTNANCPEVLVWKETATDPTFTGFARAYSVADATHFTYATSASNTFSSTLASSFTGGQVQYFLANHIACGAAPTPTSVCVVYGRASGSYAYLGHGRMGDTYWDDWGATLVGNPLEEGWIPSTPPATFQNNFLSAFVVSGAGSTSLTLSAAASTSVTSQYASMDQCPNILAAANAVKSGGGQLFFPPLTNPGNPGQSGFVIGSYCILPGILPVKQAGNIRLLDTLVLQGGNNTWTANQSGDQGNIIAVITEQNIAPGIYLASSYGSSSIDGINVNTANSNNELLILSDEGTINTIKNSVFSLGTAGLSYTGMVEDVRNSGTDLLYTYDSWYGGYLGDIPHFGNTTTPVLLVTPLFSNPTSFAIDYGQFTSKGIAYISGANTGLDVRINHTHLQGPEMPVLTTDSGFCFFQCKEERVEIDSTSAPALTLLQNSPFRGTFTIDSSSILAQDTSGYPPLVSGGFVADLEVISQDGTISPGQNFDIANNQYFGVANYGGSAATPPFSSINTYQYRPTVIPSGNTSAFGYESIPAAPSSVIVSAGGSVPTSQQCYSVAPIYISGAEGLTGPSVCVTPTGGNQTVTVTITPVLGAVLYTVYRNGLRANAGVGITGPTYVDTFSFAGVGGPKVSGDGYPGWNVTGFYGPIFGCAEQAAPSGRAGWDLLYCDSATHQWKVNDNNGGWQLLDIGTVTPAAGGTGIVNPTAHTIPIAEGASNFNFICGSALTGQSLQLNNAADPTCVSPGVPGSDVNAASYTVLCDSATTLRDRLTTIRFITTAPTVTIPDPTTSGCGNNFAVSFIASGVTVTVNRTTTATFNIYNGSSVTSGATSFTLLSGQYATLTSPDNVNWLVRIVTGPPTLTSKMGTGAGNYSGANTAFANVDGTNLCYAITIPNGWKLSVVASGLFAQLTSNVGASVALSDIGTTCGGAGTTPLNGSERAITVAVASQFDVVFATQALISGDGAAHAISLQAKTTNVADSWDIRNDAASTAPSMLFTLTPSN